MHRKFLLSLLIVVMAAAMAFGQCIIEPGKTQVLVPIGDIAVNTVWTPNNVYVLQGPTYVLPGVTLTIQPGTVIKGVTGLVSPNTAFLCVQKGATIIADGTAADPIVFTACTDDLTLPNDLTRSDRGLWGSLIVLGEAPINGVITAPNICPTNFIEGIPPSPKTEYGGCDPTDNSGIIRYVQLKHGGVIIGAANEINGLTLGGVGSGTIVEHVEVYANLDDGFEWFGGNVNGKYLVSAFNDDDDFDWDQGFSGKLQFLFAIKDSTNGDRTFEMDSDDGNAERIPLSRPTVYNVTAIGRGQLPASPSAANAPLHFKENSGGHIRNAIFVDHPRNGVFIEDQGSSSSLTFPDCTVGAQPDAELYARCWSGPYNTNFAPAAPAYANPAFAGGAGTGADLTIYGTIWWNVGRNAKTLPNELCAGQAWTEKHLFTDYPALAQTLTGQSWKNIIDNPLFFGMDLSRARFAGQNALDPRPAPESPAFTETRTDAPAEDAFFSSAPYAGAFDANNNWLCGWTCLDDAGYLAPCAPRVVTCIDEGGKPVVNVPIGDITKNTDWTSDNVYLLQGPTYVSDSATLTIEKGTIIKGQTGLVSPNTAHLVIQRDADILALGDSCCPIIFTASTDNVNIANDLTRSDRGLWGSLLILGNAPICGTVTAPNLCATNFIEGIAPSPKTEYGGCDAFDNSGIVKWTQLRHGGVIIGAANEINGLTLGGVGKGTELHHVEVFANLDDGFEWFGGTVDGHHLVSAFNDDDDFDWDQGFNGRLQFLFSIKDSTNGDRAFEMDSDDGNQECQNVARPVVYNVTAMGRGEVFATAPTAENAALHFKENSGGHIRNSIFYEWPRNGIFVEDQSSPSFSLLAPLPDCTPTGQLDCEFFSRCSTPTFTDPNWVGGYGNVNALYAVTNLSVYGTIWCAINSAAVTPALVASSQSWTQQRLFTDWPSTGGGLASVPGGLWENEINNPQFLGNKRAQSRFAGQKALDPRPAASGAAFTLAIKDAPNEDAWFASAPYAGAFNATDNWLFCWTSLDQQQYLRTGALLCNGKPGDADGNGIITISDAVFMITYIFGGGPAPCSIANGDADGNGILTISDAVYLITFIFGGGPAPVAQSCS